jgi:putative aldouronate transport system substrate-binding protein
MFRSSDYRLGQVAPPNDPWESEVRLYNVSANVYHPHVPNENMLLPPIYVLPEEVGELARLKTTINDFVDESIARFITGDLDIESEWESYVAELDTIGLERYLEIHQDAYDRQYGD